MIKENVLMVVKNNQPLEKEVDDVEGNCSAHLTIKVFECCVAFF